MLREKGIDSELNWVPAHKEIEGNELADVAAKEATGWREVKKRDGKLCKIRTHAPQIPLPFLKSAGKAHLTRLLHGKWEEEWRNETRGRALFKIPPSPARKVTSYQSG